MPQINTEAIDKCKAGTQLYWHSELISSVRFYCKGAETKVFLTSAGYTLYVPRTNQRFTTTIFIVCDEATFQAVMISWLPLTAYVDIHCHVILRKPKKLHSMQKMKTNFFIYAKSPNQAMTHASTTRDLYIDQWRILRYPSCTVYCIR